MLSIPSSCGQGPSGWPICRLFDASRRRLLTIWAMRSHKKAVHHGLKFARALAAVLLCISIAACQGVDTKEALDIATAPAMPAGDEVLGSGSVKVALIVARGAPGQAGQEAIEYRNGAALAMSDLGADHITLEILGSGGEPAAARDKARQAINDGARLIVGPASVSELDAVMTQRKRGQPPVLALVEDLPKRGAGVFTLRSDEIDSALTVGAYAAAVGRGDILVVTGPDGLSRDEAARLKKGLEKKGSRLLGVAKFSLTDGLSAAENLIGKAQAIIIFAGAHPQQAIASVRNQGLMADAAVLGTVLWTRQHQTSAELAGALVPLADQSGLREVEARMRAAYGQPMTMEAAYAYDAVALAAGVVRAIGPDGLHLSVLNQPVGFKGATGAFRFDGDGSVSRLYGIYRTGKAGLQPVQSAAEGF